MDSGREGALDLDSSPQVHQQLESPRMSQSPIQQVEEEDQYFSHQKSEQKSEDKSEHNQVIESREESGEKTPSKTVEIHQSVQEDD